MSRSTLPRHIKSFRDLPILGYRKNGRPIYPIMGGSEPPKQDDPPKNDPPKNDPPKNDPPQGPVEATDDDGVGLGYPKDTAVKDMNADQRANYWRTEAKKQQRLREAAERQQQNPPKNDPPKNDPPKNDPPSREQIEAEVRAEVSKDSALALLRTSLHTRGKSAEEIDDLIQYVSLEAFLTAEKKIDTAKVTTYLDRVAPSGSGGGGGGLPGQGRQHQTAADKAAAGKAEAEKRGFKPASGTSSLLPKTT